MAALWSLYPYGAYVNRWGLFRMQPYDNVYKKGIAGCGGRSRLEAVA